MAYVKITTQETDGKIYSNQDNFTLNLTYVGAIGAVDSAVIKYVDPDKVEGQFTAVVDEESQLVSYTPSIGAPLGKDGNWKFWIEFLMVGGKTQVSTPIWYTIYEPGY